MASARHRTEVGRRTGAGPIVDSKAEALAELMLEVAQCFFRIRALGQKTGLITSWGGGAYGFTISVAVRMSGCLRATPARLIENFMMVGMNENSPELQFRERFPL